MWTLITTTIRDRRTTLAAYCGGLLLLLWSYVAMFPSLAKQAETFNQVMENYPEGLKKAFNLDSFDLTQFGSFIAGENFSFLWPVVAIILAVSLGGAAVAGEIERGTIELLLAQPVSRVRLYLSRYVASVAILTVFVAVTVLAIIPFAAVFNIDPGSANVLRTAVIAELFALSVLSLSFLASSIWSDRSKTYVSVVVLLIGMYAVNIFAQLQENLDRLKYISLFHYFNAADLMTKGTFPWESVAVFLGVSAIAVAIGTWWFNRRDLAV